MSLNETPPSHPDSHDENPPERAGPSTMHNARIVEPLTYLASDGQHLTIPVGPCSVEQIAGANSEVIWGTSGQNSAILAPADMRSAERSGLLLLLD